VTLPIVKGGKVVGAIELSRDITSINDLAGDCSDEVSVGHKDGRSYAHFTYGDIITQNKVMIEIIEKTKIIADSISPVLIYGETGTGKELFA
jgi:arginine utilization regulatory protein